MLYQEGRQKMKRMINLTSSPDDLSRYEGAEDLKAFCRQFGCDGYEYQNLGDEKECLIPEELVIGVHLRSFNSWLDLWKGRNSALIKEYGSMEQVKNVFGGCDRSALVNAFRADLEFARKIRAQYVVFHVCEVKIEESYTYRFAYQDEEVVGAVCELINELLDGQEYEFDFLMENLWWPGFTFTRPEITRMMLEGVHYPHKGIMLDTGHLLHTDLELRTQEEACSYVKKQLEAHRELISYIKGVHLNQSLTGDFVKKMLASPKVLKEDYYERWCQVFGDIFQIDLHKPFTAPGIGELIEEISPRYLTYEFISRDRKEHEEMLQRQAEALDINGRQ